MKRVLFLSHSDRFYGAESVLFSIIVANQSTRYSDAYVSVPSSKEKDFRDALESVGFDRSKLVIAPYKLLNPRFFLNFISLPLDIWIAITLYFYCRKRKIEVIFSNTCVNITGAFLAILMRSKLIWHFHEQPDPSGKFKWIHPFWFPMYRFIINRPRTTIIFISNTQKLLWENELNISINNSKVIYTPSRQLEKLEERLVDTEISFGFMGTFAPSKNVLLLLSAFKKLKYKYPGRKIRLVLMGSGHQEKVIHNLIANENLLKDVILLPHSRDVAHFFSMIDTYVLPSDFESWGLSAIEALSLNKTLIITVNTGLSEILKDYVHCLYVTPSVPEGLFIKLEELFLDKQLRSDLANRGCNLIKDIKLTENFESSINELIGPS